MEPIVNIKQKGFTLIEVMVSLVFLSIVLLGVLQTLALYTKTNINNLIRDEAVKIGQECVENLRNGVNCQHNYYRNFRNFSINYTVTFPSTTDLVSGNNPVHIVVSYSYPHGNKTYAINIDTVIYRP